MAAISLAVAALIAGIAAAGANVWSSYNQKAAQEQANQTNIDLANQANQAQIQQVREANEFNAAQAQIARDREDTQMQRMMADYEAAGLNPLLAAGSSSAAYASPVSAQANVPTIQKAHVEPAALDFSGMASAFSAMSNTMLISAMMGRNADVRANTAAMNRASREAIASASRVKSAEYHRTTNGMHSVTNYRY